MNLAEFFKEEVNTMAELFSTKQKQYGQVDELNNFKLGALLLDGKIDLDSEFESAKAYMAKHVAFLYSKNKENVTDDKIWESLGDIVVYCHIMRYIMSKAKNKENLFNFSRLAPPPDLTELLKQSKKENSPKVVHIPCTNEDAKNNAIMALYNNSEVKNTTMGD